MTAAWMPLTDLGYMEVPSDQKRIFVTFDPSKVRHYLHKAIYSHNAIRGCEPYTNLQINKKQTHVTASLLFLDIQLTLQVYVNLGLNLNIYPLQTPHFC